MASTLLEPIAAGQLDPWRDQIARVAAFPGVYCKLSGMVTEADPACWTVADLEPFVHHVVDCFGPDRLMLGSDWPVCRIAGEYGDVLAAAFLPSNARNAEAWLAGLIAFVLPAALGYAWGGWSSALGGFLIAGGVRQCSERECTGFALHGAKQGAEQQGQVRRRLGPRPRVIESERSVGQGHHVDLRCFHQVGKTPGIGEVGGHGSLEQEPCESICADERPVSPDRVGRDASQHAGGPARVI